MRPVDLPLSPQCHSGSDEVGIFDPATDEVDEVDLAAPILDMPDRPDGIVRQFRGLHGGVPTDQKSNRSELIEPPRCAHADFHGIGFKAPVLGLARVGGNSTDCGSL